MAWIKANQAISWSQAGGSLRADSAGVWWGSMPFGKRIEQPSFVENQKHIEKDWDKNFQDRKNEIVIIGVDINNEKIKSELELCLMSQEELDQGDWKKGYKDDWPVLRVSPIN